ncbi:MAG: RecX family transcriptional regulator [Oscillospiraceae bacterium]|nr:RecX family transcriptional regulator [Oscillospiraceae bacterium]
MQITELCEHKGDTWKIELGEARYYINASIVAEFRLEKGQELTREELAKIRSADVLRKAKNRALYLLGERDMCLAELTQKLTKTYGEEVAEDAAEYVRQLGYINDEKYAGKLAEYLIKRKKFGKRRARQEMLRRGLERELAEEALARSPDEDVSGERLERIERKYANKLGDYKERQKVIAALARRGFGFDEIKQAIEQVSV